MRLRNSLFRLGSNAVVGRGTEKCWAPISFLTIGGNISSIHGAVKNAREATLPYYTILWKLAAPSPRILWEIYPQRGPFNQGRLYLEAKQIHAVETTMEEKVFHPVGGQVIFLEGEKRRVRFGKNHSNPWRRVHDGGGFRFSTKEIWFAPSSEQQRIVYCELQQRSWEEWLDNRGADSKILQFSWTWIITLTMCGSPGIESFKPATFECF